jgi:methionyl-tRNA formyltransferase
MIRGLNPWPSAYTKLNGKILKIWEADVIMSGGDNRPDTGTVVFSGPEGIGIQTGQGILVLKEIQLEGRKRMSAEAFLRGAKVPMGTKFS